MKILIVLDDPELPSSRVSALQFVDLMRAAGWDVEIGALRAPELVARQSRVESVTGRLRIRRLGRTIVQRLQERHEAQLLERAASVDVVFVIKAPRLDLLRRLNALPAKLVFHVSDAYWLPFLRAHGWRDAEAMIALADRITTTNEYTAAHIRAAHPDVRIVPDCPQVEDFDRRRDSVQRGGDPLVIGWIGTPLTATALFRIWEPLERLARERTGWTLRLVGTGHPAAMNLPRFERVSWSALPGYDQATMIDEVLRMDVGVFPLFAGDDALSRGSLKTLIYMSGGAASVSQRYGDNCDVVEHGVDGLLASSDEDWLVMLRDLIDDPARRAAIARAGLRTVHDRWSRKAVFEHLRAAIES